LIVYGTLQTVALVMSVWPDKAHMARCFPVRAPSGYSMSKSTSTTSKSASAVKQHQIDGDTLHVLFTLSNYCSKYFCCCLGVATKDILPADGS